MPKLSKLTYADVILFLDTPIEYPRKEVGKEINIKRNNI